MKSEIWVQDEKRYAHAIRYAQTATGLYVHN